MNYNTRYGHWAFLCNHYTKYESKIPLHNFTINCKNGRENMKVIQLLNFHIITTIFLLFDNKQVQNTTGLNQQNTLFFKQITNNVLKNENCVAQTQKMQAQSPNNLLTQFSKKGQNISILRQY
eukprot:EC096532.1.p1 GENE.EC096532.1~~EC096532.1.p1  ORF type:complete len:123 (-),score=11.76 EC096532.1:86-454(-)